MTDISEVKKILDFIISNSLYSHTDIVMKLNDIIVGKKKNDFELTDDIKEGLIESFLKIKATINSFTPSFIKEDSRCIAASIENDINSIDYIDEFSKELEDTIIDIVLKKGYILNKKSPDFLKVNYDICMNSIKLDVRSANHVDWDFFNLRKDLLKSLVQETVDRGYILSIDSHEFLRNRHKVVMNSIKLDINSGKYISESEINNSEVFKYLLSHGFEFDKKQLEDVSIFAFNSKESMKQGLSQMGVFSKEKFPELMSLTDEEYDLYVDRVSEIYLEAFNEKPTISSFKELFGFCSALAWTDHKYENAEFYRNVFGKIIAELQKSNTFEDVELPLLLLLSRIEKVLGTQKYKLLIRNMKRYFDIYHNIVPIEYADECRDQISKICALFVAKSKELYKKEQLDAYYKMLKEYFSIKQKNEYIRTKTKIEIQRHKLKKLYLKNDEDIMQFKKELMESCKKFIPADKSKMDLDIITEKMIDVFIRYDYDNIDKFQKIPERYQEYKKYKSAMQLIKRLNLGYIKYSSNEVSTYMNVILYDDLSRKFYYSGKKFDENEISILENIELLEKIYEYIKKRIVLKAQTYEVTEKSMKENAQMFYKKAFDIPFSDEFYEFNYDTFDNNFDFKQFINICTNADSKHSNEEFISPESILNDSSFECIKKLVKDNGLIWLLLFGYGNDDIIFQYNLDSFYTLVNNISNIINLSEFFNYKLDRYEDYYTLAKLASCSDEESIAILGKDIILTLSTNLDYTNEDPVRIVEIAKELLCKRAIRKDFTVPFVTGETQNYRYELYDTLDDSFILSGIYTHSCFTPDGFDNDFFHYCALDKNGLVIKITDKQGNFVARASGVRNGNTIFINQLRTVYDTIIDQYENKAKHETEQIIETFKKACEHIVETSQNNPEEKDKIDHIIVTRSYAMHEVDANISKNLVDIIKDRPMDTYSKDWKKFLLETRNLQEAYSKGFFKTDYDKTLLICMASIKNPHDINASDFIRKDVEPVYSRPRNKIVATKEVTKDIKKQVNRIQAMWAYLNNRPYEKVSIDEPAVVFIGDNWYMIYSNNDVIDCHVPFDKKSLAELLSSKKVLSDYLKKTPGNIDIDLITNEMEKNKNYIYSITRSKKEDNE